MKIATLPACNKALKLLLSDNVSAAPCRAKFAANNLPTDLTNPPAPWEPYLDGELAATASAINWLTVEAELAAMPPAYFSSFVLSEPIANPDEVSMAAYAVLEWMVENL